MPCELVETSSQVHRQVKPEKKAEENALRIAGFPTSRRFFLVTSSAFPRFVQPAQVPLTMRNQLYRRAGTLETGGRLWGQPGARTASSQTPVSSPQDKGGNPGVIWGNWGQGSGPGAPPGGWVFEVATNNRCGAD